MKADLFGASDPYAVCWYDGVEVGRTPVCPKTLDPIWPSDKAAFELPPTDTANPELRIEVLSQWRRRTHVWCCHRTDGSTPLVVSFTATTTTTTTATTTIATLRRHRRNARTGCFVGFVLFGGG